MELKFLLCFLILLCQFDKKLISAIETTELILDLEPYPIKSRYNSVINITRTVLKSKTYYDGIPVMKPPSNPINYILITLLAIRDDVEISLTAALRQEDLYTVGYCDHSLGIAFFLNDYTKIDASIFQFQGENLGKRMLPYGSGYPQLERNAHLKRESMKLTFEGLKNSMLDVHGGNHQRFHEKQAKFLLYITQAFSEAARFRYVQRKFSLLSEQTRPDYKVQTLENNWGPISKAVKHAVKRKFQSPIILADQHGNRLEAKTVDDIKAYMGILKYVSD